MSTTIENTHPRNFRKHLGKRSIFSIEGLQNPLPNQVRDSENLRRFFTAFPYIPYSTDEHYTSHSLVDLLYNLRYLSNTQNACIGSKQLFGFGGKIRFRSAGDDIYDTGTENVFLTGQALAKQIEVMKSINHYGLNPKKLIQRGYRSYETTGDIWIEVTLGEFAGARSASIKCHDPRNVLYKMPSQEEEDEELEVIGICKDWELAYTTEPVRHVAKYPNFSQDEEGVYKTMIHHKYGDGDFYGRPPSQGSLPDQYNEFMDAIYLIKISNKNFTGQIIYEMEDDGSFEDLDEEARNAGYQSFGEQFEKNATNEAEEPMTVIAHTRPMGARPSVLHQIKPNTSEAWYTSTGDLHRTRIIMSHQWSERLLGVSVPNGFDSNVFLDEAFVKDFTVLDGLRADVLEPFNDAYEAIFNWLGTDTGLQIDFKSMIDEQLQMAQAKKQGEGDSQGGGGVDIKSKIDAYSIGVRSGSITPQISDEDSLRLEMGLPPLGPEGKKAWSDDEGVRRPITLKSKTQTDAEIDKIDGGRSKSKAIEDEQ